MISALRPFRRSKARRLLSDEEGVAAVEFAIFSPLFFIMLFSFFDLGVLMIRTIILDDAVARISRDIYTGGSVSQAQVESFICDNTSLINDCIENIAVEATVIDDFSDVPTTTAPCRDSDRPELNPNATFSAGGGTEIVFLRVCLTSDLFLPWYGFGRHVTKTDNGRIEIISSLAIQNELF